MEHDASLAADMGEADMHSGDEHAAALTLHGMVRRVARLAGETSWTRYTMRQLAPEIWGNSFSMLVIHHCHS